MQAVARNGGWLQSMANLVQNQPSSYFLKSLFLVNLT